MADGKVVQVEFIGSAAHGNTLHRRRVISRSDAKAGWGITITKDLVWDRANGFKLNVEDHSALTSEVLERLDQDPKFKLHRVKEEPVLDLDDDNLLEDDEV